MLAGAERRLPNRTFVDLAITHDDEHAACTLLHPRRERHADADRQPMAERAGRGFDARHLSALRVPTENAVDTAEAVEVVCRDEAFVGEDCIVREATMSLAQNAAVAL